jgi:hypothetical protein
LITSLWGEHPLKKARKNKNFKFKTALHNSFGAVLHRSPWHGGSPMELTQALDGRGCAAKLLLLQQGELARDLEVTRLRCSQLR